jgi:hypothetical protein
MGAIHDHLDTSRERVLPSALLPTFDCSGMGVTE